MNLYLTADRIGTPTGGGAVTHHEYRALAALGEETHPVDSARIPVSPDPFVTDDCFWSKVGDLKPVRLAAFYAGCFTNTIRALKASGARISYTAAAHDIPQSRKAFEELGVPYDYPHLIQPDLWKQYIAGYLEADLVICPSKLSKTCMESYGCKNVIVIPHGCEIPNNVAPIPRRFTVGYLGQAGPDKGLRYLFEAWRKLNLKDATLLIAGDNVDFGLHLWRKFGGGNVEFMGFVKSIDQFFNRISIYVQPSVTEAFGIEVLEAMAYGRPVVVSTGAGAAECVREGSFAVNSQNVDEIVRILELYASGRRKAEYDGKLSRDTAIGYGWNLIREKYQAAWQELLK